MSRLTFYIVLGLTLVFPAVSVMETTMYQLRSHALEHQHNLESQLAVAQHTNAVAQQLVQRISIDSIHDPALSNLLRKYGIRVKVTAPPTTPPTETAPAAPTPAPSPAPATTP